MEEDMEKMKDCICRERFLKKITRYFLTSIQLHGIRLFQRLQNLSLLCRSLVLGCTLIAIGRRRNYENLFLLFRIQNNSEEARSINKEINAPAAAPQTGHTTYKNNGFSHHFISPALVSGSVIPFSGVDVIVLLAQTYASLEVTLRSNVPSP